MDTIQSPQQLREIYGEPMERAVKKQLTRLDRHSPQLHRAVAVSGRSPRPTRRAAARRPRPRATPPGFVRVVDDHDPVVAPPARQQPHRHASATCWRVPGIGLIFFVPGVNETRGVNGRAQCHDRPGPPQAVGQRQGAAQRHPGRRPRRFYFHCGKALILGLLLVEPGQTRRARLALAVTGAASSPSRSAAWTPTKPSAKTAEATAPASTEHPLASRAANFGPRQRCDMHRRPASVERRPSVRRQYLRERLRNNGRRGMKRISTVQRAPADADHLPVERSSASKAGSASLPRLRPRAGGRDRDRRRTRCSRRERRACVRKEREYLEGRPSTSVSSG